ncbi:AcrR family transcriptional regulator [Yoonia maritima]|uniref:AcrR family transcriptional regulator n=1 Tax=Yoonia maritima TaxID=1435347 RepID=A0A2T0VXB0_9RHOB|nr:TetR/AcrR family transcriptional regulator [Yoonia maritima]PRY76625.1 AcrR family transcriptional regulator [Yoonia maritima]
MARKTGADGRVTAEAILRESLSLFAQYGFATVSMRQIADKVGVQPGAIYQHHRNKQQLLVAVLDTHMDGLLKASAENQQGDCTSVQALERFARFHIQYHITRPDEVFVSYMELRSLEEEGYALIEGKRRKYERILKSILERGVSDGTFQLDDPHVSAMAILSMLTGVNTWYRSGGRLSQQKIEDIYTSMVLGAVGHRLPDTHS